MICKICNSTTKIVSNQLVLNKYKVDYHQCSTCHFIQTDEPYWLAESYENAITALDIGLVSRNIYLQNVIPPIIEMCFPEAKVMIDYAGGYGMFVRMMRDLGYNFYRQDIYCENLFANYFDLKDCPVKKVDIVTAFEVFEHLHHPIEEIGKMFELSDNIVFSTVLSPSDINEFHDWWYVSPLIGQHISFYDLTTLSYIAVKFGKKLYSNGNNLHVFTSSNIEAKTIEKLFGSNKNRILKKLETSFTNRPMATRKRESLLESDYKYISNKLSKNEKI